MEQAQKQSEPAAPVSQTQAAAARRVSSATLWTLRLLVRGGILLRLQRNSKSLPEEVRKTLEMPELEEGAGEPAWALAERVKCTHSAELMHRFLRHMPGVQGDEIRALIKIAEVMLS